MTNFQTEAYYNTKIPIARLEYLTSEAHRSGYLSSNKLHCWLAAASASGVGGPGLLNGVYVSQRLTCGTTDGP
jgi:hypothetical protein